MEEMGIVDQLLSGRCRNEHDSTLIHRLRSAKFKRQIDIPVLFTKSSAYFPPEVDDRLVCTDSMRWMAVLAYQVSVFSQRRRGY
jgi:hypothetical protein